MWLMLLDVSKLCVNVFAIKTVRTVLATAKTDCMHSLHGLHAEPACGSCRLCMQTLHAICNWDFCRKALEMKVEVRQGSGTSFLLFTILTPLALCISSIVSRKKHKCPNSEKGNTAFNINVRGLKQPSDVTTE